jgi:hypothetical protein
MDDFEGSCTARVGVDRWEERTDVTGEEDEDDQPSESTGCHHHDMRPTSDFHASLHSMHEGAAERQYSTKGRADSVQDVRRLLRACYGAMRESRLSGAWSGMKMGSRRRSIMHGDRPPSRGYKPRWIPVVSW